MDALSSLYDLDRMALEGLVASWGEPSYRASQIWEGLYRHLWQGPEQFSPLPHVLRERMGAEFQFGTLEPEMSVQSADQQTQKTLFRLPGGEAVETVLMRYRRRLTLCISTQAGCAMGCVFCATGQMGFRSHLTSGQIVEQVLYFARKLLAEDLRPTNVVVMGMGEPFHNYEATLAALDRLNHPAGFGMGARRFTLSTVGLVPQMRRFASEGRQYNLAVSLHAADDDLRSSMLPINKKYPLDMLMEACREVVAKTGRRITFEWALIQGVNDSPEQAARLARLVKGVLCHVNVIPLNPTRDYTGRASSRDQAGQFQAILEEAGISCTIRSRRGIDIEAGCGQLAIYQT